MANKVITDYSSAVSVDPSSDYMLVQQGGSYRRINRNVLLGVTGTPMDTSTAQNVTNKTLDTTNTVSLLDTLFSLKDNSDPTKIAMFQLSGITTGTTRTYTLPNGSSTLVDLSTAQALTNKTLTSPTITGGTIDNSTITVDAIGEHTAANGVTVDGMNIKDGKLNTNNSVVTANVTDTAITPAKLQAGTGAGWALSSWVPTWSGVTVGNGTVVAKFIQTGKLVFFRVIFTLGTTSAVSGDTTFTLPVTANSFYSSSTNTNIGNAEFAGSTGTNGFVYLGSTTLANILIATASGTYVTNTALSATAPFGWTSTNWISAQGVYEVA